MVGQISTRTKIGGVDVIVYGTLISLIILTLYPFVFMMITSTKSYSQFLHNYWLPAWPLHIGENYIATWNQVQGYLQNTIFVSIVATVGFLVSASMSGFVFARYQFPGKEFLFSSILILMMIPQILQLIPAFMWVRTLGLLDTR
ncbi:hypothetical protein KFU94_06650 [Chloroflexi bacterium TSY]|nr:hypothetical protein [Chloroflexi bacterium TSY]